jgi:hypothetical protein
VAERGGLERGGGGIREGVFYFILTTVKKMRWYLKPMQEGC